MRKLIDEGKITSLSRRDIISHIKEKGWVFDREGKHTIYKHPDAKHIVEVPRHNVLEIGTAKQIIAKTTYNLNLSLTLNIKLNLNPNPITNIIINTFYLHNIYVII